MLAGPICHTTKSLKKSTSLSAASRCIDIDSRRACEYSWYSIVQSCARCERRVPTVGPVSRRVTHRTRACACARYRPQNRRNPCSYEIYLNCFCFVVASVWTVFGLPSLEFSVSKFKLYGVPSSVLSRVRFHFCKHVVHYILTYLPTYC